MGGYSTKMNIFICGNVSMPENQQIIFKEIFPPSKEQVVTGYLKDSFCSYLKIRKRQILENVDIEWNGYYLDPTINYDFALMLLSHIQYVYTDLKEKNNVILCFTSPGDDNLLRAIEYMKDNESEQLVPFVIFVNKNDPLKDFRKLSKINYIPKGVNPFETGNWIISKLFSIDAYYNELGSIFDKYLYDNHTSYNQYGKSSCINIFLTGESRAGKSCFVNLCKGELCARESPDSTAVTVRCTEYIMPFTKTFEHLKQIEKKYQENIEDEFKWEEKDEENKNKLENKENKENNFKKEINLNDKKKYSSKTFNIKNDEKNYNNIININENYNTKNFSNNKINNNKTTNIIDLNKAKVSNSPNKYNKKNRYHNKIAELDDNSILFNNKNKNIKNINNINNTFNNINNNNNYLNYNINKEIVGNDRNIDINYEFYTTPNIINEISNENKDKFKKYSYNTYNQNKFLPQNAINIQQFRGLIKLIDSPGFDTDENISIAKRTINNYVLQAEDPKNMIHCVLYFLKEGNVFSKEKIKFLKFLHQKNLRIFFIINYANDDKKTGITKKSIRQMVREEFGDETKKVLFDFDDDNILQVNLKKVGKFGKPIFGVSEIYQKIFRFYQKEITTKRYAYRGQFITC